MVSENKQSGRIKHFNINKYNLRAAERYEVLSLHVGWIDKISILKILLIHLARPQSKVFSVSPT